MARRIVLTLVLAGVVGFGIYWWLTMPPLVIPVTEAAYTPAFAMK